MHNTILFLGDSFTWGEGLELYSGTDKWNAEQSHINRWPELVHKQDEIGIHFRESNRFSALVGKELNCEVLVDKKNGGSLGSFIREAESHLFKPYNTIDTIIIQFSCLDRDMYHLTTDCHCDVCVGTNYSNLFTGIYKCLDKFSKNKKLDKSDKFILDFFERKTGYLISDDLFFEKFDELRLSWNKETVGFFLKRYVEKWEANGLRKIYFIDSWDTISSDVIFDVFSGNHQQFIPLIGEDRKRYLKWQDWENTFAYKRIDDEFYKTKNQHPTLIQHQHIAESIVEFLGGPKEPKQINKKRYLI
jgi:hypothetical protein